MHLQELGALFWNFVYRCDEDTTDRMSYHHSCMLLIILSAVVTARQLVGTAIECWVPATFTAAMESYTENYCYVQSTYWVPLSEPVPENIAERDDRRFGYYQWVPFFLAVQAFLVYSPSVAWKLFRGRAGLSIESLVRVACSCRMLEKYQRAEVVNMISVKLRENLIFTQEVEMKARRKHVKNIFAPVPGSSVAVTFFLVKLTYLVSTLLHLLLLDSFIGSERIFYGWRVLLNLAEYGTIPTVTHFPRITLCDFLVRVLGNVHRHTVQCVLTINLFNEKIFVFIWVWFGCVACCLLLSLFHWAIISVSSGSRIRFVRRFLSGFDGYKSVDNASLRRFVVKFLRQDGIFLIRMTSIHAGELVACELTREMWRLFRTTRKSAISTTQLTVEEEIFCRERNFRVV